MKALRKSKVSKQEIARLYTEGLLTMQEIGDMAGISKQAVRNVLNDQGIEYRGGTVKRICHYCKVEFDARRKQIKRGRANHCSVSCFHAERVINPDRYLVISEADRRNGNRTARKIMDVKDKRVVHHIDGDPTNNDPANLRIFDTSEDHIRFHHSLANYK